MRCATSTAVMPPRTRAEQTAACSVSTLVSLTADSPRIGVSRKVTVQPITDTIDVVSRLRGLDMEEFKIVVQWVRKRGWRNRAKQS